MWPSRDVRMELTGEDGKPVTEWWVLSWQDKGACPIGIVFSGHGTTLIGSTYWKGELRLQHLTAESNVFQWGGSYDWYLNYLVLFPPACGGHGYTWFQVVAPGHMGSWKFRRGCGYPWEFYREEGFDEWRCHGTSERCLPAEAYRCSALSALRDVADLLDELSCADPELVRKDDLIAFLTTVIDNAEAYPEDSVFGKTIDIAKVREYLERLKAR